MIDVIILFILFLLVFSFRTILLLSEMGTNAASSADRLKVILSHLPKKPGNIPFDFLVRLHSNS